MSWFQKGKKRSERPAPSSSSETKKSETPPKNHKQENPAVMRVQKDLIDVGKHPTYSLVFPNPKDLLNFNIVLQPDSGFYQEGRFTFSVEIPSDYPFSAPRVHCKTRVFHPNIDQDGNVCLNILRGEWNPVLGINHLVFGLTLLFDEPNPDNPLDREAAELLRRDKQQFARQVRRVMRGY